MVGRSRDCRVIKYNLLDGHYGQKLISIVGMTGIGKTTLVRSVYGDPLVASHFDVRAWITMPQEYNESQMLCDILLSITLAEPIEIIEQSTPDELVEKVHKCLEGKRYLIVLDNFWNNRAWDDIRRCFPNDNNQSCILLTTRQFHRYCYASIHDYIHHMTFLDPNESWDLFCHILSLKENMASKFEKIRSDVVNKCEGLPQLIVAVAKRLYNCNNIQQQWEKIEKEMETLGILDHGAFIHSYNQLPLHLKVCFLYLVVFPKRFEIQVRMLIRLWIAEGFVESENIAYAYLQELIDCSLVLVNKKSSDGKFKTCRMNSALHSFCVGEVQKEGIFCAVSTLQHPGLPLTEFANSCRWLSLYTHRFDYYVLFSANKSRSIFFFNGNPEMFISLKLLRVLAFVPSSFFRRAPMHSGDLVFLRYLYLTQWHESLDSIVSSILNLQTLVVSGVESQLGVPTLHLPSTIWESPKLRHLELGELYTLDPPRMNKEDLQTLSWVTPAHHWIKKAYHTCRNLKELKVFWRNRCSRGCCSNSIILDDNLNYLVRLERLTISVSVGCVVTFAEQFVFPSQLKKLRLNETNLSVQDLTVIGTLHQLEVLKLENAFHKEVWKWEVVEGGLRRLKFIKAKHLEQLMANEHSFPSLERLVLRFCYCLKEIPLNFAYIDTLRSIELDWCSPSALGSTKKIREAQHEMGKDFLEIKFKGHESHIHLAGLTEN